MPSLSASILIVDDDPDIQEVLADRLAALGYQVSTAATGGDGLARLEAEGPQLVLLDLGLPFRSGASLLADLKGDPATAAAPVGAAPSRRRRCPWRRPRRWGRR